MADSNLSRRDFLRTAGIGAAAMAGGTLAPPSSAAGRADDFLWTRVSEHLLVYHGPINVGVVNDNGKALLIDCGDARVAEALGAMGIREVHRVVFTHHHRDQACGAPALRQRGAKIGVPAGERDCFEQVAAYWNRPGSRWHLYNFHPHHLMLGEPLAVDDAYQDGASFEWGPARIRVLATPGHTDGSVSYLVEVDGHRVIFSGDAIYDHGQVWDLHSLQRGFARGKRRIGDYHGFLGAHWQLSESLARIKAAEAEMLIPSHGRIMRDPSGAIDAVLARLAECYDKYVAISALRHYFPDLFAEFAGRKDHMAIRPGKPVPACLRHFGTTWMLVSEDRSALVMDCGGPHVVRTIRGMLEKGEIRRVEGLWVTHYHDDHVDAIPEFQKAFDCPCITDRHVAEVISDPIAWRLPCISPSRARVDRPTADGESWQWHEFKLTAYHYPGQTLYHAALLAETANLRMFFVGDSHTAAGIDDYCAQNRNWLGPGAGFDRCIAMIEKLQPTHIFNCHVEDAFDFTADQCRFMRENLAERQRLFGQLTPWDHANYAMDDSWVRCHPYEQTAAPGARVELEVVITNHSATPQQAACRGVLHPAACGVSTERRTAEIAAGSEQAIRLCLALPAGIEPGRHVLSIDLRYGPWDLPQYTEAIVVVPG